MICGLILRFFAIHINYSVSVWKVRYAESLSRKDTIKSEKAKKSMKSRKLFLRLFIVAILLSSLISITFTYFESKRLFKDQMFDVKVIQNQYLNVTPQCMEVIRITVQVRLHPLALLALLVILYMIRDLDSVQDSLYIKQELKYCLVTILET